MRVRLSSCSTASRHADRAHRPTLRRRARTRTPPPRTVAARAGRMQAMGELLDHVRSYYEALNSGDPDRVAQHFTDDAVHYYTRLGPHEGARAIGEHTQWAVQNLGGRWNIEDAVDDGERV